MATHEGNSRKDLQRLQLKESAPYKGFNVPRASEQAAKVLEVAGSLGEFQSTIEAHHFLLDVAPAFRRQEEWKSV